VLNEVFLVPADRGREQAAHAVGFPGPGPPGQQRLDAADVGRRASQRQRHEFGEVSLFLVFKLGAGAVGAGLPGGLGQHHDRVGEDLFVCSWRGRGLARICRDHRVLLMVRGRREGAATVAGPLPPPLTGG
jgi:hypothetical protein